MTDETVFATALEQSNPAERAAYLESACAGDPEQRNRIEGLLAALHNAGHFLERPATGPADPDFFPTRTYDTPGAASGDSPTRTADGDESPDCDLGFLALSDRPGAVGRIGHYDVLEILGRGGFGVVFRAFDDALQRVVAVKVLAPAMAVTSPARKRFLREALAAARVQHENVVRIHAIEEQPLPYLVMEFVPGETLQQRLDRIGPLEILEALRVGRQIAEGLAAAHEKGLIHRDIKPSNILIECGAEERAKITDFGLARAADDASLTRSGVVAGTPMYMAPEQARGETLDHRADLFSLGSVLYAMLTGHPPFRASGTMAVLKRVCDEHPRPIREVIPEVPEWLCRIVEKLHAKNPADRFQSAKEVADLLGQYLAHLQQPALVPMPELVGTAAEEWLARNGPRPARVALYCGSILFVSIAVLVLYGLGKIEHAALPALAVGWIVGASITWYMWRLTWRGYRKLGLKEQTGKAAARRRVPGRWQLYAIAAGLPVGFGMIVFSGLLLRDCLTDLNRPGSLTVLTSEPDLVLTLDGQVIDSSHFSGVMSHKGTRTVSLLPGEHRLQAYKDARVVYDETFTLAAREVKEITIPRSAPPGPTPPAEDGWVQLFNGKDLTGWKTRPAQPGDWKVENRELVGCGLPGSYLFSDSDNYENFHLRAEVKLNATGNSGVFFRTRFEEFPHGYEADLTFVAGRPNSPIGTLWKDAKRIQKSLDSATAPDQWFTLEVIAVGARLQVLVDGKLVADFTDPAPDYRKGHIALQALDENTVVRFRKIEIKELPPGKPNPTPPLATVPFDAPKANELQVEWATHLGVPVEVKNTLGMKLRLIPPGEFSMTPDYRVTLSKPFRIGAHEVTVAQFRAFVKDRNYQTDAESSGLGGIIRVNGADEQKPEYIWSHPSVNHGDDYPVAQLSWRDAAEFCKWLSEKEGKKYRLPTEAEWEWACRAGSNTAYHFGNDAAKLGDYAWYQANAKDTSHPVGLKKPNAWGLFDMHGNVAEYCSDWYADALPTGKAIDPGGPAEGEFRALGSFGYIDKAEDVGTGTRAAFAPNASMFHFGLRVVCEDVADTPKAKP